MQMTIKRGLAAGSTFLVPRRSNKADADDEMLAKSRKSLECGRGDEGKTRDNDESAA
jgi:hypothetical protein